MGPFQVISAGRGTYCLDLLPNKAIIHPLFYTSLFKSAKFQPDRPPMLEDDSYKVEAIFQINKRVIYAKVK